MMPAALSATFAAAFTLAFLWFVGAMVWRARAWWQTPNPLPIPLAPAPRTRLGVAGRLAVELFAFRSLARASPATWLPAILFHYGLLVVLIVHLRFLFELLPLWLLLFLQLSGWATLALVGGLAALLLRRAAIGRLRRISVPSDYLHVVLLLALALSGAALKRLWPVDVTAVGRFVRGLFALDWQPLPAQAGLIVHLALALVLLAVFPISKLVHAVGIAFAPTFHQRDPHGQRGGASVAGPDDAGPSGAGSSGAGSSGTGTGRP